MKALVISLLGLSLILPACERGRTTRAAGEYQADRDFDRDSYENFVRARLEEFELRFDGLEARMKGLHRGAQERLQVDLEELRGRKEALEQKFNDLRKVSSESWLDLKASMDRELERLELAYNVVSANNHGADQPLKLENSR
jgi:hypothetical protein